MTTIDKEKIKDLYITDIIFEMHQLEDKISVFKNKYKTEFAEFENEIKRRKTENFEKWDDYMEWKSLEILLKEMVGKKNDIENGNIKVA
jgi:hypothetical protein